MSAASSKVRAWLELVRPPNLFTVPGDPLAGFFLAVGLGGAADPLRGAAAAAAALLIYAGGLVGNDVADVAEDQRDRPKRPIPSGRVSRRAAYATSAVLAVAGLAVAFLAGVPAFGLACVTQAAVMLYNGWLKHYAIPGALAMGACRGGSFLMGVAAAWPLLLGDPAVLAAAAAVTAYIAGVTWIADRETVETRIGVRRWIPAVSLGGGLLAVMILMGRAPWSFTVFAGLGAGWALYQGWRLSGIPPRPVLGASIGCLIRGLLLVQAAFCSLGGSPGLAAAAALVLVWPVSAAVAKRFYAT